MALWNKGITQFYLPPTLEPYLPEQFVCFVKCPLNQGSYRNLTAVFQTFPGQNYFFFPDFSRHFVHLYVKINITKLAFKRWNFLYNVFYSKYRMGLKFLNSELQMLCVMNCKKINKCISNQQCNRHLYFPGQHYSFQGFFQTFPYLWSFSRLFKALKISTLNSRIFHTGWIIF